MDCASPKQVAQGDIREVAAHAIKLACKWSFSIALPLTCLSYFLEFLQYSPLIKLHKPDKPFLLQVCFGLCFITAPENRLEHCIYFFSICRLTYYSDSETFFFTSYFNSVLCLHSCFTVLFCFVSRILVIRGLVLHDDYFCISTWWPLATSDFSICHPLC